MTDPRKPKGKAPRRTRGTPRGARATPASDPAKSTTGSEAEAAKATDTDAVTPSGPTGKGTPATPDASSSADKAPTPDATKPDATTPVSTATGTDDTAAKTQTDASETTPPQTPDKTSADSAETSASDRANAALTEEEQLEIAEAALRDAERNDPVASDRSGAAVAAEALTGTSATATSNKSAPQPATASTRLPPPQEAPKREVVVEKRGGGGFLAGVAGGVVAVIGAVIAGPYVLPETMRPIMSLAPVEAGLEAQSAEISAVAQDVEALGAQLGTVEETAAQAVTPDVIDTLEARLTEIQGSIAAQGDELSARIEALATDFASFERSPLEDSTDPAVIAALASYARDVEALRAEVAAQTAENTRVIEDAAEATAEARAAAEAAEQRAEEQAEVAAREQALVDIKAALNSGAPFADELDAFGGDVPDALSSVASQGVATLASLQASFAEPARAALDAARRSAVGDAPADRGLSFLQTQLGMRSLAPRDGDSADAILSRAEAATRAGDLSTAIAELGALPDAAAAPMQDWIARATSRANAISAADALAQSMATN